MTATVMERTVLTHIQVLLDGVRGDVQEHLTSPDVAETACSQVDVVQLGQFVHLKHRP